MKLSKLKLNQIIKECLEEAQSCANKKPGESNAQWRARCGPRPLGAISRGGPVSEESSDHEGKMAKSQLERSMKYSKMIYNMIDNVGKDGEVQMPAWVQSKLTKSMDYLQSVYNYLDGKDGLEDKFQNEEKLTEATDSYVVWSPLLNKVYDGPVSEKKALMLIKKYAKQGQYHVGMLGTKYFNKTKLGKKNPVKEDFGSSAKQMQPFSSKEAKKVIDDSVRQYATLLRKAEGKIIKDWMTKAKAGVIDYFDIVRGLQTGDISRAYPFELRFLKGILDRDKIMNRFRSYFGGKKGKRGRRK